MGTISSGGSRFVIAVAVAFGAAGALGVGCFPSYIYDGNLGTGGATGSTSTTTVSSMTTASTGTMGGGASTTTGTAGSSTASSATTSGGPPCATRDCSDPTCKNSFACVPAASALPTGWTGYFALYEGSAAGVPGCSGTWPTQGYEGNGNLMASPATCPVTCGAPSGGKCEIPELDISDAACNQTGVCTGPITPPTGYVAGNCFNFPDPTSGYDEFGGSSCGTQQPGATSCSTGTKACNVSASSVAATVTGSSCAPSATMPNLPAVKWGSTGQACGGATPGTGCGSSDTCMPIPESPFVSSGVCIMQAGNLQCPGGQFTDQHIFYSGTTDTRGCTDGTCGAPSGESCTVTFTLYQDSSATPSCQTLAYTADSGQCIPLTTNPPITSAKATIKVPPNGGMCASVDGQPTGTLAPTGATTFCCIP